MPIYEYRCTDCGTTFEELTFHADDHAAVTCRSCAGRRVTRVLSAFAVHAAAAESPAPAGGPCGACGAPRRGMCGE